MQMEHIPRDKETDERKYASQTIAHAWGAGFGWCDEVSNQASDVQRWGRSQVIEQHLLLTLRREVLDELVECAGRGFSFPELIPTWYGRMMEAEESQISHRIGNTEFKQFAEIGT